MRYQMEGTMSRSLPTVPTILQVIPRLDTGGAELATLEITEALVAAGARALVVSEGGRLAGEIARLGGELIALPVAAKNPLTMAANAHRLARLISARGVALVHARSRAPAWSALAAARRRGRPFVTTYHGAYGERSALKRLYNSVMARGDLVIANSHYTAELVRARHGASPAQLRVVHRGVDLARFNPEAVARERISALRNSWGVAPAERIILHAARLTGWKGQRDVIEAARLLEERDALGDAVIILAGDDQGRNDYARSLAKQIATAGLTGRVRLVGHCGDMPAAFASAHVAVVASSEPEAFGRTVAEAQAMACPVIATNLGAPPEIIRSAGSDAGHDGAHATGWLVPPGAPAALADAMARALAMPAGLRDEMGRRARAHVARHFSLAMMKRATLAVYDELLGTDLAARLDGDQRIHGAAAPFADSARTRPVQVQKHLRDCS